MPNFFSGAPKLTPGSLFSTTNAEMPHALGRVYEAEWYWRRSPRVAAYWRDATAALNDAAFGLPQLTTAILCHLG